MPRLRRSVPWLRTASTAPAPPRRPLGTVLDGPPPALPAVLDGALERWSALPPRVRAAAVLGASLLVATGGVVRVARSPYGPPVTVAVVDRDLAVGADLAGAVVTERRPATLVPRDAVADVPGDATLALGVVGGTVLTVRHLRPGGPLADLPGGAAAVPVPAESAPGAVPGRRVDVVVVRADGGGAVAAADARVLATDGDRVWLAVPRTAAPDVAAAAARGQLAVVLLPG